MVPDDEKIAIEVVATVASASRVGKGAFFIIPSLAIA
jgi:hypothetical protein